jgi:hypothetical protein
MSYNRKIKKKDYLFWRSQVFNYLFKIIRKIPNDFDNIELETLYEDNYHPYVACVMCILESKDIDTKKIYESFVIPYENKIVIVEKNSV